MFIIFIFVEAFPFADSISVAEVICKIITQFGIFDILISDLGSEFISRCTKEVCRLIDVKQEFTPSFLHHCLGARERQQKTKGERMTPYIEEGKNWENVLPLVLFSMNSNRQ